MTVAADAGRTPVGGLPASVPAVSTPTDRFTAAYREHGSRVLGYLRARGADDPESLTQEVFLAFYARIDEVTGGEAGVRTFLFSMAHARLVDHFRAVARRPALSPYDPDEDLRTTDSAEQHVVAAAGDEAALTMVARLPDDQREVIALRVIVGLSLAETAHVMGRSDGAVKQLQRRALERLRQLISERHDHG